MDTVLRNYEAFIDSLRCFDWLPDEVSGASDLDLMLERRGRLLFVEAKKRSGPELYVPLGQFIALRTLAGLANVSVWLVAEDEKAKAEPEKPHYAVLTLTPDTKPDRMGLRNKQKQAVWYTDIKWGHTGLAGLRSLIAGWWEDENALRN